MTDTACTCGLGWYGILTWAIYLEFAIVIQVYNQKIATKVLLSSQILNQVANDWVTQPFVDVKVVTVPLLSSG
jgi:hypothetical protein